MKITGRTKLLGVIGHPVTHSLSPLMHNAALEAMGLDYVYVAFPIAPDRLDDAITGFAAIGVAGFNITIPHKQTIIPHLTEISDLAKSVGAVNTVWPTSSGWHGTNTDVDGFIAPLQAMARDWSQTTVLCLGNGGAARAVVAGAHHLGCRKIEVFGRNPEKLQHFYESWQRSPLGAELHAKLFMHPWSDLATAIPQADLIVNTTPIGMHPNADRSPLSQAEAAAISANAIAYDLIYIPYPTQFLQQARDQGAIAINGLEMLVQQGAAALQIWTQAAVPIAVMRQALQQHLGLTPID
jgi:shikimate dehydrogenase